MFLPFKLQIQGTLIPIFWFDSLDPKFKNEILTTLIEQKVDLDISKRYKVVIDRQNNKSFKQMREKRNSFGWRLSSVKYETQPDQVEDYGSQDIKLNKNEADYYSFGA